MKDERRHSLPIQERIRWIIRDCFRLGKITVFASLDEYKDKTTEENAQPENKNTERGTHFVFIVISLAACAIGILMAAHCHQ